ncbi:MAG: hypothetical protein SFV17_07930 [Candidatus Obscuribacter sp.]|nr:hypothetical protein [Candidatus Obscuribacter sp.]
MGNNFLPSDNSEAALKSSNQSDQVLNCLAREIWDSSPAFIKGCFGTNDSSSKLPGLPEIKVYPDAIIFCGQNTTGCFGSSDVRPGESTAAHSRQQPDLSQTLNKVFDLGQTLLPERGQAENRLQVRELINLGQALLPQAPSSAEQQAAINAADAAAGKANSLSVVSSSDLSSLESAKSGIFAGTAQGQFAIARIDAAISKVDQQLEAARKALELGAPLSQGDAQQFRNAGNLKNFLEDRPDNASV